MWRTILLTVLCSVILASGQSVPIKVSIDANRSNQEELLRALNSRGTKFRMVFSLVDHAYDYRIAFETGETPRDVLTGAGGNVTGTTVDYPTGIAVLYDGKDHELFRIKHEAFWNENHAISGTAKDIVRRLQKWRSDHPGQD